MNIGRNIINKIKDEDGYGQMELNNNVELNNLIELMANELKPSFASGDGPEWESKVLVNNDHTLFPSDMIDIIKKMISKNPRLDSTQLAKILYQKRIYGLEMDMDRSLSDDDFVKFNYSFPELDFIKNNLVNGNDKLKEQILKKVILPFYKSVKERDELSNNGESKVDISEDTVETLSTLIAPSVSKGMREHVVAEYYLYNILRLNSKEVQDMLYDIPVGTNIFTRNSSEMENIKNILLNVSDKNINYTNEKLNKFNSLLYGISSQLYMNSRNLEGKSPKEIEEIIKKGYSLYTQIDSKGDNTYSLDESGYRTVNVGLGQQDVFLHAEGDNIKRAMEHLTANIQSLVQNSKTMSIDDYIKEVAKIHYRYISIHPFRDSNGRIGRNIINMLLSQRGRMFEVDIRDKKTYSDVMNKTRDAIPLHEYLDNLVNNPDICSKYEEMECGNLTQFIKDNTYMYNENIHKKQENESMRRWHLENAKSRIYEDYGTGMLDFLNTDVIIGSKEVDTDILDGTSHLNEDINID